MRMIAVRKDEQEEEEEVQRSYEHVYGRTILIKPYLPQLPKLRVTAAPSVAPSSCLHSASSDGQKRNAIACWL